ncbi:MAG TPA: hypothetical protein VK662_05385 [Acidothermaceae bacterium]|jgi:hypothetical protein|nr:hypothetical protein [Acidothermaceae bacterium]
MKGCLTAVVLVVLVAFGVAAITSGGSHPEPTFEVWENNCRTLQSFTRSEVLDTWGQEAIAHQTLQATPARINRGCEVQLRKEGKTP